MRYYKQRVTVWVLSEGEPAGTDDLSNLAYLVTDGPCVGEVTVDDAIELTAEEMAEEMAKALVDFRSDPEFFDLDLGCGRGIGVPRKEG